MKHLFALVAAVAVVAFVSGCASAPKKCPPCCPGNQSSDTGK